MNKFNTAFTLAEVLITLVIVGIVAAMTIPSVINRTNEAEYTAGAKKLNSNLVNAVRTIQSNGVDFSASEDSSAELVKQFCSVMSCAQVNHSGKNFFADEYTDYYGSPNFDSIGEGPEYQVLLNNGTVMSFAGSQDCSQDGVCSNIVVDINGPKGPNAEAKDLYIFYLRNENGYFDIYPQGLADMYGVKSLDSAIRFCLHGHICAAVRIFAPDELPKTQGKKPDFEEE